MKFFLYISGLVLIFIFLYLLYFRENYSCRFENRDQAIEIAKREVQLDSKWRLNHTTQVIERIEILLISENLPQRTVTAEVYVKNMENPFGKIFLTEECLGKIEYYVN